VGYSSYSYVQWSGLLAGSHMGTPVRTVMVLGYGTMGRGVLASFAAHGFTTFIVSRNPDALEGLPEGTIAAGPDLPALESPPDLISACAWRAVFS
jgi:glutamyl-tRNA reductase